MDSALETVMGGRKTASPDVKLELKGKTLNSLLGLVQNHDKIDCLEIVHRGMAIYRRCDLTKILQMFLYAIYLEVKHLKFKALSFDIRAVLFEIERDLSNTLEKELLDCNLRQITFKDCENPIPVVDVLLRSHKQFRGLTIRNCQIGLDDMRGIVRRLKTNYTLRTIDINYSETYRYHPSKGSHLGIKHFNEFVTNLQEIATRNQEIHNSCLAAITAILLSQKSKTSNPFSFIGRDCTRLIAKFVLASDAEPVWLQDRDLGHDDDELFM
jgi:hypothetical protein